MFAVRNPNPNKKNYEQHPYQPHSEKRLPPEQYGRQKEKLNKVLKSSPGFLRILKTKQESKP